MARVPCMGLSLGMGDGAAAFWGGVRAWRGEAPISELNILKGGGGPRPGAWGSARTALGSGFIPNP